MHNIITIRTRKFRPIRYRKKRKTWTRSKRKWKKISWNDLWTTQKKRKNISKKWFLKLKEDAVKKEKELEKKNKEMIEALEKQ